MKAHNPSCSSGGDIRPPFWPVPWWFQVMASSVSLIHHQKNTCNGAIMLISAPSLYFRIWKILLTLSLIILNMPNLFITSQVFSLHGNMLVRFFCVCVLFPFLRYWNLSSTDVFFFFLLSFFPWSFSTSYSLVKSQISVITPAVISLVSNELPQLIRERVWLRDASKAIWATSSQRDAGLNFW